jgi:hypothetical protein
MAMGQPHTHSHLSGQLHVQIPVTVSGQFNLSSASSDNDIPPFAMPAVPSNNNGYRAYSSTAGLASLMAPVSLGLAVPRVPNDMCQGWSQESSPQGSTPSPQFSPPASYTEELRPCGSNVRSCFPPRHPAHTLNASVLPFVASAIPNVQNPPNGTPQQLTEEEMWEICQNLWLEFDGQQPPHAEAEMSQPLRLKWNRFLHMPRSMMGRKLAGKWDDNKVKTEETGTVRSIKSAPSIL